MPLTKFKYNGDDVTNSDSELAKEIKDLKDKFSIAPEDAMILISFKDILDTIAKFYNKDGDPVCVNFEEADTAFCSDDNKIVLPPKLMLEFYLNNLPTFCVFYHELGHALYSGPSFHLIEKWKNISSTFSGTYGFDKKYLYLLNWLEDFYIEAKLVKSFPYLSDIIRCIRLLPHLYDATKREFAFHYYYQQKRPSPSFDPTESKEFLAYLNDLTMLRCHPTFGKGPLSLLNKQNANTRYITLLKEFHNWCVTKQIYPDVALPPLSIPSNIIQLPKGMNGNGQNNNQSGSTGSGTQPGVDPYGTGSYSAHTNKVGKPKQVFPKLDPNASINPLILHQFKTEKAVLKRALNSYRHDTQKNSLYGVFTEEMEASNMIGKPIIPNFFNTNRLEDRILFKQPGRTFTNVSIYRDISGSTTSYFDLIDKVCGYLDKNIPIDKHFYLYSSGNISIMETEYQEWTKDTDSDTPELYVNDPIFQQMDGGTNSDAIADVMSEQMNDKWLNIIVTDGDLYSLFARDNIEALLHNVAVVEVNSYSGDDSSCKKSLGQYGNTHYVKVKDESDIPNINDMLYNIKEEVM